MTKKNDRIRPGDEFDVFGHRFRLDATGRTEAIREKLPERKPGEDYGADPIGDGTFRMVPSGDIVSYAERERRLARFKGTRGTL